MKDTFLAEGQEALPSSELKRSLGTWAL